MEIAKISESVNSLVRLESVIVGISAFLSRHGIHKRAEISPKNRQIFLGLPIERLDQLISHTELILDVHLEAEQEPNFDLDDSVRLLNIALRAIKFSVDPSFFSMVKRSDILEVYDNDHIQIFRSFNFFRICNYDLDDILSHEWFDLYERAESVTGDIFTSINAHLQGSHTITKLNMEPHLMRERFSETRGAFMTRFKYLANIYSGPDTKQGFAVTLGVKAIPSENSNFEFISNKKASFP